VLKVRSHVALPESGDEEILIEAAFAGVNRHDCNQRARARTSTRTLMSVAYAKARASAGVSLKMSG